MRHAVDRAERIADAEARAALDPHAGGPPLRIARDAEARRIERRARLGAADAHVDIGHIVDAQPLAQPVEAPIGDRIAHRLVRRRDRGRSRRGADIEPGVEVIAALAFVIAAHLAEIADHFVPAELRAERPRDQRRADQRGRRGLRKGSRCGAGATRGELANRIGRGIGDIERARAIDRQPGGADQRQRGIALDRRSRPGEHLQRTRGGELDDASALEGGDIDEPVVGRHHPDRAPEQPGAVLGVGARERRDLAVRQNLAQRVVAGIRDEQRAAAIERDAGRRVERRRCALPVGKTRHVLPRQCPHLAVGADRADAIVIGVGDIDIALVVHRDADRPVEPRLRRRAVAIARRPVTRERRDRAVRADPADTIGTGLRDEDIPRAIERDPRRGIERSGQSRHIAVGVDLADAPGIGDVKRPVRIDRHRERIAEARLRRRAVGMTPHPVARHIGQRRGPAEPRRRGRQHARPRQQPDPAPHHGEKEEGHRHGDLAG